MRDFKGSLLGSTKDTNVFKDVKLSDLFLKAACALRCDLCFTAWCCHVHLCHLLKMWSSPLPVLFQVLCNGPGTCVPLCLAGLLLGFLGIKKVFIVYIESICRVETLSLTGKILYLLSDYFFVQWSSLRDKYPKSVFLGRIVWICVTQLDRNIHFNLIFIFE